MSVITYPDGSTLTSTALTKEQVETAMQLLTCQLLGIVAEPWTVTFALAIGQAVATPTSLANLYGGQVVSCTGVPTGTQIASVNNDGTVTFTNPATISGLQPATVVDPSAFAKVRIGWQQQGQPGWGVNDDIAFVRSVPVDADYSRGHDVVGTANSDGSTILQTDQFTREWKTFWCFYGPNSIDNGRAVRSALGRTTFVDTALAELNLYVNPSIAETVRVPELFQGQWWERVDFGALFNEAITETLTVNAVASVEVLGFTREGQFADFTVDV